VSCVGCWCVWQCLAVWVALLAMDDFALVVGCCRGVGAVAGRGGGG
jgi:hypothetical protein